MTSQSVEIEMQIADGEERDTTSPVSKAKPEKSENGDTNGKKVSETKDRSPSHKLSESNGSTKNGKDQKHMKKRSDSSSADSRVEHPSNTSQEKTDTNRESLVPSSKSSQSRSSTRESTAGEAPMMFARAGDKLRFAADVSKDAVLLGQSFLFNLEGGEKRKEKSVVGVDDIFQLCVGVQVEARLVEVIRECQVCGFTVPIGESNPTKEFDDASVAKKFNDHIMTHSLKEICESVLTSAAVKNDETAKDVFQQ